MTTRPRLEGRIALVTGGASGVGRATAQRLAAEGARVAISDLNEEGGRAVAAELGAETLFVRQDVAAADGWPATLAAVQSLLGPLDILVNNAGILIAGTIETLTLAQWQTLQRVNADSVFLGTQAGVAAMKSRGGAIINIASVASWLPIDTYLGYGASKAAVAAVTRAAALHCRKSGYPVRVNSVHPDGVWTPMMEASTRAVAPGIKAEHVLYNARRNPKGRACLPAEVAAVVAFLASDDAQAVHGAELRVDNGILGMGL